VTMFPPEKSLQMSASSNASILPDRATVDPAAATILPPNTKSANTTGLSGAASDCPANAKWSMQPSDIDAFRQQLHGPTLDSSKAFVFKPELAKACEYCGFSSGSSAAPGATGGEQVRLWGYNYKWNERIGTRDYWTQQPVYQQEMRWWEPCPDPYVSDTYLFWKRKCILPDSKRFLGESCSQKSECTFSPVDQHVDSTCAPTIDAASTADQDWKCMLDEDARAAPAQGKVCSCIGLLYCSSDDCGGNMCVLSTQDMQKHCKFQDDDGFLSVILGNGQCSNCRASKSACTTVDGTDPYFIF